MKFKMSSGNNKKKTSFCRVFLFYFYYHIIAFENHFQIKFQFWNEAMGVQLEKENKNEQNDCWYALWSVLNG